MTTPVIARGIRYTVQVVGTDDVVKALGRTDAALDQVRASTVATDKATDGLAAALRDEASASKQAGRDAKALSQSMDKGAKSADRLAKSVSGVASGLAAAAAAFGASALLEMAEEGSALQTVSRRLDEIGVSAQQVEEIGTRLGGGSTAAVEQLVAVAREGGLAFEDLGTIADAALNMARARGLDSHEVMKQLNSAIMTGRTSYLQQQGVIVDTAAAQREYAEGIGKTVAQLTKQEKMAASSKAILKELNDAFAGQAPDKYASNIGAVRDRLDNLADTIKRKLADALNDLGAALSGGTFASDPTGSRAEQAEAQVARLERLQRSMAGLADSSAEAQVAIIRRVADDAGIAVDAALDTIITVTKRYDGVTRSMVDRVQVDSAAMARVFADTQARLASAIAGAKQAAATLRGEEEARRKAEADRIAAEEQRRKAEEEQRRRAEMAARTAAARARAEDEAFFESVRRRALVQSGIRKHQEAVRAGELSGIGLGDVGQAVGSGLSQAFDAIRSAAEQVQAEIDATNAQLERMFGLMGGYEEAIQPAIDAVGAFGRQMAQNIVIAALYGESFSELAKQALEGLAVQAGGEALFQLAKGLAALGAGVLFPPAAKAAPFHFASAGVFAGIAGVSGAGAAALGGFERGGGASAGGGAAATRPPPAPTAAAAGPVQSTVIVDFRNRPLTTQREIEMGVVSALQGSTRRAGRRRVDSRRMAGGR